MNIPAIFSPHAHHSLNTTADLDPLLERIGSSKYVLLGEASHGTHEYYTWRAKISKRLIEEKGFNYIAVEGDWPDCYKINQWIKNRERGTITDILHSFERWPTWMWANWEIAAFANWMKSFNTSRAEADKIGFYGLDVYSLWESMDIISAYLEKEDPSTAKLAREAIACFEPYRTTGTYKPVFNHSKPGCREQVINLLKSVRRRSYNYNHQPEAGLNAEINALIMANAEKYFRSLTEFSEPSWNIRDKHMMEILNLLQNQHGPNAKVIVWAHNTHIGDARATDMAENGLINIGQLTREEHSRDGVVLVGFGSYTGGVIAGKQWGAPMQEMKVPEAIPGSIEHLIHQEHAADQLFIFDKDKIPFSEKSIGHRAIGVVYHPHKEWRNYVPSKITERYDAFIFIDQSRALHPIHITPDGHTTPETYPFGI